MAACYYYDLWSSLRKSAGLQDLRPFKVYLHHQQTWVKSILSSIGDFHCRTTEQVQDQERNSEWDVLVAKSKLGFKRYTKFVQYLYH
jgi:hypothetical protein